MSPSRATVSRGFMLEELERVTPFLFTLLENAPEFIMLLAPDGTIRFINRTVPGLTMVEVIGRSVYDYLSPGSHAVARACFRRVLDTGEPCSFESTGVGPHRAEVRYESRVGPVRERGEVVAAMVIAHDITARVELEQHLRVSRDQLEIAVAASGLGLWEWDIAGDAVSWSEVMLQIFQLDPAEVPKTCAEALSRIHPDDRERVRAQVERVRTAADPRDEEFRIWTPSGHVRWVMSRGKAVRDPSGRVTRVIGGTLDITDQKRATEALRTNEERYRSLFAVAAEGILLVHSDRTVLTCNASAERILGLSGHEVASTLVPGEQCRAIREDGAPFPCDAYPALVTLTTGQPQQGVVMGLPRPSGGVTWISVNTQPLLRPDAELPEAVVCSFFDISERKLAEAERERLLAEEQRARRRAVLLAEVSQLLLSPRDILASLTALVRRLVPDLADLAVVELLDDEGELGAARHLAIAADEPALEPLYLDLRQRAPVPQDSPLHDVLRRDEVRLSSTRPGAALRPLPGLPADDPLAARMCYRATVLVPLVARAAPFGVLLVAARRRVFNADELALLEEVGLRAAQALDNARLYTDMELALAKREEFIAVASHELRTPLTPILLQVERLLRDAGGGGDLPPARVIPKLRVIQRQAERLHRLVEELLDVSQITGGQLRIKVEDVDLAALLRDAVARFAEPLARASSEVHLDAPEHLPGRIDRARFKQIVSNLLANAIKYGPGRPIEVSLAADADAVELTVRDHGIGISAGDQARLFQRFERAVSRRHYGGFGLGLWTTRHLAEAMGGSVRLTSAPEAGSTFVVRLPREVVVPAPG